MKHCKHIRIVGIVLSFIIFMRSGSAVAGNEKMETVFYYVVQPGDNLWKISEELYGDVFPKNPDERFMTEQRIAGEYSGTIRAEGATSGYPY